METKDRRDKISTLFNELARSDVPEMKLVRELLALHAEDAKERLVDAMPDEFARIQGEAKIMDTIVKKLVATTALLNP